MFAQLIKFLLPAEPVSIATAMSRREMNDRIESIQQTTRQQGGDLIASLRGDNVEIRLHTWRRFIMPQFVFRGRILEMPEGTCLDGNIEFPLAFKAVVRIWTFVMLAMLGAMVVIWTLGAFVDGASAIHAIVELLMIVSFFLLMGVLGAAYMHIGFAVHRPNRRQLLSRIEELLSVRRR